MKCCSLLTSNYHFYMQSENFKCNVLYLPPIITFTCQSMKSVMFKCTVLYWHPIITFTCNLKFSSVLFSTDIQLSLLHAISNFQVYCSLLTSNYHFYMQSQILQVYCSLLTSNYHFYMQSEIFKCNVLYLPPIITFTCQSMKSDIQLSLLHAIWKFLSVMFANNHFYMPKSWNQEMLKCTYHFYMQSEIFKCTVLYWHPIITFTCQSM